jgi:predicted dithiol-disulfide oxidoreductase (DUF899 family)
MTQHATGTREDWLAARLDLLAAEKALTRRIDKDYRFETDAGEASLADLFAGRSQLMIYHFMFGPEYEAGCASCSAIADGFDGFAVHLANHDVTLMAVSYAPLGAIQAFKRRMGWTFPWASSLGGEFNSHFGVSLTEDEQRAGGVPYNYRPREPVTEPGEGPVAEMAAKSGTDVLSYTRQAPGMSAFAREAGVVHHTYSTYARGLDGLWGMFQWLYRAPLGRNETSLWWRHHDAYSGAAG